MEGICTLLWKFPWIQALVAIAVISGMDPYLASLSSLSNYLYNLKPASRITSQITIYIQVFVLSSDFRGAQIKTEMLHMLCNLFECLFIYEMGILRSTLQGC